MQDFVEIARAAAAAGVAILRERAGHAGRLWYKSSPSDLVTDTDIASGVAVVREIAAAQPSARFVVEEPQVYEQTGVTEGTLTDGEIWVVDPLDGTTSYVHGYPCYSVSVAFLREGLPVAGAVCNAFNGEMFAAGAGRGARLDARPIRATAVDSIDQALLITGFPYDRHETLDRQLRILERVLRSVEGLRRDGSAAIDCCQVACGRADGFWELALQPWDTAAGALVAQEAGAKVTDFSGRPWSPACKDHVIAGPALHPVLLELIQDVDKGA